MRYHLDRGLQDLKTEIGRMGALVEESVEKTILALKDMDEALAREIIGRDDEIDGMETRIEKHCMSLFALQQPLAGDLRMIGSSLKMITDLERIADHSADIAEITLRLIANKSVKMNPQIYDMAEMARSMVRRSIDAFINQDIEGAEAVCRDDDTVDRYFSDIIMDLVNRIKASPDIAGWAVDVMFIVKYLERMADHATNISEWAIYHETGKHQHLQHPENHVDRSEME
jgi:phosphate transport system protein